ncbi:MAG TPA: hypothetical protein VHP36_00415 [Chitinispirillaceae bacterium]|nr:hypothetical protein [Chitinispirillaceae bacterium]
MNRFFKCLIALSLISMVIMSVTGCKSGPKAPEVEARIKALLEKGVPDSVVADAKIALYNVNMGQKTNNSTLIRKYSDSMAVGIEKAEKWYSDAMASYKPYIDNLKKTISEKKSGLTGLHLKTADSLLAIADSFANINWLVQAKAKMDKLDSIMPVLLNNEKTANDIKKSVIGKWMDAHIVQAEDQPFKARSIRFFNFGKDGKFESAEEMVGQTTPFLKEDWKFISWGNYDFRGDTIVMSITREKCPKQIFTQLWVKENKWKKDVKPTYDSTFTNPKIETILYKTLKEDFKKER